MNRSIFGWDLPPGCTHRQIEEAMGADEPPCCENCTLPECDDPESCEEYKVAVAAREIEEEKFWNEYAKDMNPDADLNQEEYLQKNYNGLKGMDEWFERTGGRSKR